MTSHYAKLLMKTITELAERIVRRYNLPEKLKDKLAIMIAEGAIVCEKPRIKVLLGFARKKEDVDTFTLDVIYGDVAMNIVNIICAENSNCELHLHKAIIYPITDVAVVRYQSPIANPKDVIYILVNKQVK